MVSSPPEFAPSTRNCTPATPTLSEADALSVTSPETMPAAGAVTATVGAIVSDWNTTLTWFDGPLMLPAASRAATT